MNKFIIPYKSLFKGIYFSQLIRTLYDARMTGLELARDSWGGTKRRMGKVWGATPFICLAHPPNPLKFAYVTFKMLRTVSQKITL